MNTTASPSASAQAHADALYRDDALAQSKGESPEHRQARQRVARLFCELHLPDDTPADRDTRLAAIDYTFPVTSTNARGVDVNNNKSKGFLGMGRKKAYIISLRYPPQKPEDPVYALEYTPIKR